MYLPSEGSISSSSRVIRSGVERSSLRCTTFNVGVGTIVNKVIDSRKPTFIVFGLD